MGNTPSRGAPTRPPNHPFQGTADAVQEARTAVDVAGSPPTYAQSEDEKIKSQITPEDQASIIFAYNQLFNQRENSEEKSENKRRRSIVTEICNLLCDDIQEEVDFDLNEQIVNNAARSMVNDSIETGMQQDDIRRDRNNRKLTTRDKLVLENLGVCLQYLKQIQLEQIFNRVTTLQKLRPRYFLHEKAFSTKAPTLPAYTAKGSSRVNIQFFNTHFSVRDETHSFEGCLTKLAETIHSVLNKAVSTAHASPSYSAT